MDRAAVESRVHALLDAWNARDLDAFVALMTDDVYWHDLGMPNPPALGRPAVRAFAESALRAFPDFQYVIRAPICVAADCGSCLVPFTLSATHTVALDPPGFAPVNRTVHFDGLDYITFRGDLIARIETRVDLAEPIEQLTGVVLRPPRGSWRERGLVTLQRVLAWWIRSRPRPSAG